MNRYYISNRIGSGAGLTPYDSEIRDYIRTTYGIRPKINVIAHTFEYAVLKYDLTTVQHNDVMTSYPLTFSFPAGALDREFSTIPLATRNAISAKLIAMGFDISWVVGANTVRELLQFICHSIQLSEQTEAVGAQVTRPNAADFNLRTLTVAELRTAVGNLSVIRIQERMETLGIDTSWITNTTPVWQIVRRIQRQDDDITPREFGTRQLSRWFYHDTELD